jgi:hypothetical protein
LRHPQESCRLLLAHASNAACQFPHEVGVQLEIFCFLGSIADRIENIIKPLPFHFFNSSSSSGSRFLTSRASSEAEIQASPKKEPTDGMTT